MRGSRLLFSAGVLAALVGVTVVGAPVSASLLHSVLLATSPAAGSVVTRAMAEVTLTFDEPVRASFSAVTVTGPDARPYGHGELSVLDNVVHQRVYPLRSGDYEVDWRVVSGDGHPVTGTFRFSVRLPEGQEPSVGPPVAVAAPDDRRWLWWWVLAGAGLLAAAVALQLVHRSRGRRLR